jgi:hypothetical protein
MTHFGELNIITGWIWMSLGITSGSILGMWAFAGPFKAPKGHENYTDLPRRMVRLAHIAFFMLPLISIVYGQYVDQIPLPDVWKQIGSYGMLTCMIGVPIILTLASRWLWIKYLEIIPVGAGTVGFYIMSWGYFKIFLEKYFS